jgi:hypothetical protein
LAFTIDKETFETVLGNFNDLIIKSQDKRKLVRLSRKKRITRWHYYSLFAPRFSSFVQQSAIKIIVDSKLSTQNLTLLSKMMVEKTYKVGTSICQEGKSTDAALYLVRSGKVEISGKTVQSKTISRGGFFGDDQLMADQKSGTNRPGTPAVVKPDYSATVTEDCTCSVLTLAACRQVFDTTKIGKPEAGSTRIIADSIVEQGGVPLEDLTRHIMLGAGTFGQVWLVSRVNKEGNRTPYALKVQSKYELVKDGQAKAVVYEKNVMVKLQHPFLLHLVCTYKDDQFVYMLLDLIQGGELYSYIHTKTRDGMPERDARFYGACVAEGLGFMHRRGFVYRDLKPEVRKKAFNWNNFLIASLF